LSASAALFCLSGSYHPGGYNHQSALGAPWVQDPKPAKPAETTKPAEAPLDESVNVEALLESRLPTEDLDLGWIRLLDGQSLLGWKATSEVDWKVQDGAIVATEGKAGFLLTEVRFSDYEIELEFLAQDKTNSGLFLRTSETVEDPAKDCYEINIAPQDNPFPTGSIVGRAKVTEQVTEPVTEQVERLIFALGDQTLSLQELMQAVIPYHAFLRNPGATIYGINYFMSGMIYVNYIWIL
jgi:hypothetical protein